MPAVLRPQTSVLNLPYPSHCPAAHSSSSRRRRVGEIRADRFAGAAVSASSSGNSQSILSIPSNHSIFSLKPSRPPPRPGPCPSPSERRRQSPNGSTPSERARDRRRAARRRRRGMRRCVGVPDKPPSRSMPAAFQPKSPVRHSRDNKPDDRTCDNPQINHHMEPVD